MSTEEQRTAERETAAANEAGAKRWLENARARCAEITKELYGSAEVHSADPAYRSWRTEDAPATLVRSDDMKYDAEHRQWVNATPQEQF
jgi:hypothetical protein